MQDVLCCWDFLLASDLEYVNSFFVAMLVEQRVSILSGDAGHVLTVLMRLVYSSLDLICRFCLAEKFRQKSNVELKFPSDILPSTIFQYWLSPPKTSKKLAALLEMQFLQKKVSNVGKRSLFPPFRQFTQNSTRASRTWSKKSRRKKCKSHQKATRNLKSGLKKKKSSKFTVQPGSTGPLGKV